MQFFELDSVGSTNSWLLEHLRGDPQVSPCAVFAHEQTAGRGRLGRQWASNRGRSLCFSVGRGLAGPVPSWLSIVAGVQVLQGLQAQGAVAAGLKWPNDLMLGRKKLGGILCESVPLGGGQSAVIVGVGINLRCPENIQPTLQGQSPAGLDQAGVDVASLDHAGFVRHLSLLIQDGISSALAKGVQAFLSQFRQHDVFNGQQVSIWSDGQMRLSGKALSVAEDGAYLVNTPNGLESFQTGEISLRGLDD